MNATGNTKMLHGYLINPADRTIKRATLPDDKDHLRSFYELLDCTCVDALAVHFRDDGAEDLWIDDEALITRGPKHFFTIRRFYGREAIMQRVAGRALLLASNVAGDTVSSRMTEADIVARVIFHDVEFLGPAPCNVNCTFAEGVAEGVIAASA